MSTLIITHEVDDVAHWLASTRREQFFGAYGANVREFVDPSNASRIGLIVEGMSLQQLAEAVQTPEAAAAMAADGVRSDTLVTYEQS